MDRLSAILDTQSVSDLVRGYLLSAFSKLVAHHGSPLTAAAREIQEAALSSSNPDIQQRALELESIIRCPHPKSFSQEVSLCWLEVNIFLPRK